MHRGSRNHGQEAPTPQTHSSVHATPQPCAHHSSIPSPTLPPRCRGLWCHQGPVGACAEASDKSQGGRQGAGQHELRVIPVRVFISLPDAASLCKGTERVQAGLSVQRRVTSV